MSSLKPFNCLLANNQDAVSSVFEAERVEFFHRCSIIAEVVDGRSNRREGERIEWRGEQSIQVIDRTYTNGDMRAVVFSAVLGNEDCDILNERRNDVRS